MENKSVYSTVKSIILKLENSNNESEVKAILASLRNYNGNNPSNQMALSFIFSSIPDDKLGNYKELSRYEDAVLTALRIYAIYRQGSKFQVYDFDNKFKNFGYSLGSIRNREDKGLDDRANILFTTRSYEKLKVRLFHITKLLKSKSDGNVKINFAKLAQDIYNFSYGDIGIIKISWARDYYRYKKEEKTEI